MHDNVLKKITPVPNNKGVMVVEVDKVVRDLKMLQQTIKSAKFYRLLMSTEDQIETPTDDRYDSSVQIYRELLNDLLRMVVKLNNGTE